MTWRVLCFTVLALVRAFGDKAPTLELNTKLMHATVRLDGATKDGPKVGTGFIMGRPMPDNPERVRFVLITANHVLDDFKAHVVRLTTRKATASGAWERVVVSLPIRDMVSNFRVQDPIGTPIARGATLAVILGATRHELKLAKDSLSGVRDAIQALNIGLQVEIQQETGGFRLQVSFPDPKAIVPPQLVRVAKAGPEALLSERQFWTRHPQADVAAMYIRLPVDVFPDVLPTNFLADDAALKTYGLHPGDELNCLGYPLGAESDASGFPILRSGKIASYPLLPTKVTKSFLMDFQVFGGNSGGPVYLAQSEGTRIIDGVLRLGVTFQVILGLVSEEVVIREESRTLYEKTQREYPLKLAKVIHASLILDTVTLLTTPAKDR